MASAFFVFLQFKHWDLAKVFFVVSAALVLGISVVMFLALYKMKQTIQRMPRLKRSLNVQRMCNHSLAYIIYMGSYITETAIFYFGSDNNRVSVDGYATWLIITIAALASHFFFFLIIWNLGTKDKPKVVREPLRLTSERSSDYSHQEKLLGEMIEGRGENGDRLDGQIWGAYIRSLSDSSLDGLELYEEENLLNASVL